MNTTKKLFSTMSYAERLLLIEERRTGRTVRLVSHKDFKKMCKVLDEGTDAMRVAVAEILENENE